MAGVFSPAKKYRLGSGGGKGQAPKSGGTLLGFAVASMSEASERIDAAQRNLMQRLETIGSGQAAIAELTARAHAASLGNGAPLPVALADDPILEKYLIGQPADRASPKRALAEWRKAAAAASSAELTDILTRQYRPSPTDTPEARLLRYQLAAISREELLGRRVTPPAAPTTTRTNDHSAETTAKRSAELAELWRAGESTALFGEPELAGALDLFDAAEGRGRGVSEDQLAAELATLHRTLGDRLAAGERPSIAEDRVAQPTERAPEATPERPR